MGNIMMSYKINDENNKNLYQSDFVGVWFLTIYYICTIAICKMFTTGEIMSRTLILKHRWKLCHIMTWYTVCNEHSDDSNKTQKGVNTVKFEINVFMLTNFINVHAFVKTITKLLVTNFMIEWEYIYTSSTI